MTMYHLKHRTWDEIKELVSKAIHDVCELAGQEITDLHISDTKAMIDFEDGTKYWFLFSYGRIEREDVVAWMVDYFLSVKRTDEEELADSADWSPRYIVTKCDGEYWIHDTKYDYKTTNAIGYGTRYSAEQEASHLNEAAGHMVDTIMDRGLHDNMAAILARNGINTPQANTKADSEGE